MVQSEASPEDTLTCTIYFNRGQFEILKDTTHSDAIAKIKEAERNSSINLQLNNKRMSRLFQKQQFNVTLLRVSFKDIPEILRHACPENECALRANGTPNDSEAFFAACVGLKVILSYNDKDSPLIVRRNAFEVTGNTKPPNWQNVNTIQVTISNAAFNLEENCTKNLLLDLSISSVNYNKLEKILKLHQNKLADVGLQILKETNFHEIVGMARKANFELDLKISDLTYDSALDVIKNQEARSKGIEARV